jgi:hypothetical protein
MATLIPPQPDTTSSPRRPRRTYLAVLTIQLIVCMAGVGWVIGNSMLPSDQPSQGLTVDIQPSTAPQPGQPIGTRTKDVRGCARSEAWSYTYPTPYLGEVYVDLTANPSASVPADVTLTWGPWRWEHVITIRPGMVQFGQGGTLLLYSKLYTTGRTGINPPIFVNASVPVCAYFGTAADGTPKPLTAINANPGWYHWNS